MRCAFTTITASDHGENEKGKKKASKIGSFCTGPERADSPATMKAAVSCVFSKPFSCHGLENRRSVLLGSLPTLVWLIFTSVFLLGKKLF